MSRKKKFEFDHTLRTTDERRAFINENIDKISSAKYLVKSATTYLLRADDVESERLIEYSFYRDENKFFRAGKGRKLSPEEWIEESRKSVIKKDRFMTNKEKEEIAGAKEMFSDNLLHDLYVNEMFRYSDISLSDIKKTIKKGCPVINEILDENLRTHIIGVYDFMIGGCQNETDIKLINLASKGISDVEIAEELGVMKQTVGKRFKKILINAKKRLTL